ncbi:MAG: CPBP family intramembrane glutamic endopeptidase [Sedimentisphaerales bacterium]|jgi:membrane protease YdiL (CAAX protease family)
MARRTKSNSGQWFNFTRDSYLERTSRPIYALVYLLPFIAFYELGTIFINTDVLSQTQIRVVAFVWLQEMLRHLGLGGKFLWATPALVVVVILLAYQLVSKKRWWVSFSDMLPMTLECITLAIPLIVLSLFLNNSAVSKNSVVVRNNPVAVQVAAGQTTGHPQTQNPQPTRAAAAHKTPALLADIVTGIGAGIYEELLFRLILICALMLVFQDIFGWGKNNSIVLAVLISAGLFGAHHHIDFLSGRPNQGDPFDWAKFAFRTTAGVYFAVLFAVRGFGITAGTHAFYDIIATLINALMFHR